MGRACEQPLIAKRRHSVLLICGRRFGPEGLSVAKKTVENFVALAIRLYEQEPGEADASSRLGLYSRRWIRWANTGLVVANIPARNGAAAG